MYKNQLQELAQRSCFNLPSYSCIREGPDHAPRFKATVNFNGDVFESPFFCTTLRQAEHAAAEVALSTLSKNGPSRSLAARVLDETGVYKNLLQETAHRAGVKLPVYTTVRSGPGHTPIFSCTVELAGMNFCGEPAKTKKQAQKNSAMAAWSALKQLPHTSTSSSSPLEPECNDEQDQVVIARLLASLHQSQPNKPSPQRPPPLRQNTNPTSSHSYYPIPSHNWIYPNFSPEPSMYQMWQQPPIQTDPRYLPMFLPMQTQLYPGNIHRAMYEIHENASLEREPLAAPVRIRSGGAHGPRMRAMMAPAVNVRTVVLVCSAPPVRMRESRGKNDEDAEISSDFRRLHI